jgi:hypothetical protein
LRRGTLDEDAVIGRECGVSVTSPHIRPGLDRALFTRTGRCYIVTLVFVAVTTQMRWVRVNRRVGAWAALFALTLQITLSFGHVHLAKFATSSSPAAGMSLAQAAGRDGGPANPPRHTGANDFCAICATIALVASSVLPEPSALLPLVASERGWLNEFAGTRISFDPFFLFQARAPPAVL